MNTNLKTGNLMTGNWWSRWLLGGLLLLAPLSLVACAADGGSSPVGCSTASTIGSVTPPGTLRWLRMPTPLNVSVLLLASPMTT